MLDTQHRYGSTANWGAACVGVGLSVCWAFCVRAPAGNELYDRHWLAAVALVCLWVVGIPLALLGLLLRQWRWSERRWASLSHGDGDALAQTLSPLGEFEPSEADMVAAAGGSLAVYNYSRMRQSFGFCVDDFRPECFWYEPFDMLRKLALSGLLQLVEPGTGAQVS